eukprot:3658341-Ditylum_brightwellii.AAC.1
MRCRYSSDWPVSSSIAAFANIWLIVSHDMVDFVHVGGMTCDVEGWWGTLMAFHPLGVGMTIGGMQGG